MLTLVESQSPVVSSVSGKAAKASACSGGELHVLAAGDILFREGDARTQAYRVEAGAVCLFKTRADGANEILKFAFPGDIVGLGYVDRHATSAQAAMETALRRLPRALLDSSPREASVHARSHATVIEPLVRQAMLDPMKRVVALFVTLSHQNVYEGREASIITDSLTCGTVAGHLDMSLDELAEQLAELEARGLIEPCDQGLRLLDVEELERLSDGPIQ